MTDVRLPDAGSQPPPPSPFAAVRHHPFLFLLPIVVAVAGAIALSVVRQPEWKADARISVGELNPSAQTAPGVVEANQQLASAYSRAVTAKAVIDPAARSVGVSPGAIQSHLTATPVEESPIFTVSGTGDSRAEAVDTTKAATDSLVSYVRGLGDKQRSADELQDKLEDAQREVLRAERAADDAGPNDDGAEATLDAARVKASALRRDYLNSASSNSATPVSVINPAEQASSDQRKFAQLAIVIAILAGLAIGVGLATLRASVRHRRRYPAPDLYA